MYYIYEKGIIYYDLRLDSGYNLIDVRGFYDRRFKKKWSYSLVTQLKVFFPHLYR